MNYNKYHATRIEIDGHKFPSKLEGREYLKLKKRLELGQIQNLELQPKFLIQEGFKKNGKTYRKIEYVADFSYIENGKRIIEDTKGRKTDVYEIKKKLFEYKYPELTIKEVYR